MQNLPKVGAFVLDTLTTGMYQNPLDAIRELIQNSADAIRDATVEKLLSEGEGRIELRIDPDKRTLTVRDTGTGILAEQAAAALLNIGMSSKRIDSAAGFRGIGRLAAIAYCQRLTFRTSAFGENTGTVVSLDCDGIRKKVSPALRDPGIRNVEELPAVLNANSKVHTESSEKKEHFFEVKMEGILDNAGIFLDTAALEEYLCQVAPVDYDHSRFPPAGIIHKWVKDHGFVLSTVNLIIKRSPSYEKQVFKPYRTHYKAGQPASDLHITGIEFFPENPQPNAPFWIWRGKNSDFPGQINKPDSAGFRFRKNNISIGGPQGVEELFEELAKSNDRFNYYFIGEMHILDSHAVPNARRDSFEQEGKWPAIRAEIMPFIEVCSKDVRDGSKTRNQSTERVVRMVETAAKEIATRLEKGIASPQERDDLLDKLQNVEGKASQALKSNRQPAEKDKIQKTLEAIAPLRARLEKDTPFAGHRLRTDLDRKQRQVVIEMMDIVYATIAATDCPKRQACADTLKQAIMARFGVGQSKVKGKQ